MQITQHTWTEGSLIQEAEIRKLEGGMYEAYVYAPDGADAEQLAALPGKLAQKGFSALADNIEGRDVLRVTGFKSPEELKKSLQDSGVVSGNSQSKEVKSGEKRGIVHTLRKKSVNLAGLAAIMGHASVAVSGILEKDKKRMATSALYMASTATYAINGAGKAGDEFGKFVGDLREHLEKVGVELPESDTLTAHDLSKKGGLMEGIKGFIEKYPLQIANTLALVGNISMIRSGLADKKYGRGRVLNGAAAAVSGLSIMLIPEKKRDAQKPKASYDWPGADGKSQDAAEPEKKRSLPIKVKDWIQEKPMRFAGMAYLMCDVGAFYNLFQTKKKYDVQIGEIAGRQSDLEHEIATDGSTPAREDLKKALGLEHGEKVAFARKNVAVTTAIAASYFLASCFTSISSKAKVKDYNEQEILSKLCAASANLLVSQPEEQRADAIEKVADYLVTQPDATESKEEIIKILNEKVDQLTQSPWLAKVVMDEGRVNQSPTQAVGVAL